MLYGNKHSPNKTIWFVIALIRFKSNQIVCLSIHVLTILFGHPFGSQTCSFLFTWILQTNYFMFHHGSQNPRVPHHLPLFSLAMSNLLFDCLYYVSLFYVMLISLYVILNYVYYLMFYHVDTYHYNLLYNRMICYVM